MSSLCVPRKTKRLHFSWIRKGFNVEPPSNDSGANFSEMIRIQAGPKVRVTGQKSEIQTKSQSYSRADPQNPNRIAPKRPPNGVQVLLQKTPPKAFLNPPKLNLVNFGGLGWGRDVW